MALPLQLARIIRHRSTNNMTQTCKRGKTRSLTITFAFLLVISATKAQDRDIHWQINKEHPACGLTLGYLLPKEQLQAIVGDQFTPKLDKEGKGYLMLFIASSPRYELGGRSYDHLQIAHILVLLEGSLLNPLIISEGNPKLDELFAAFQFAVEPGTVDLLVEYTGDSIRTQAAISTAKGRMDIAATFLNKPGDWKTIPAANISSPSDSNSFFSGPETYRPIPIPTAIITHEGENWITNLNLPPKPDKIWLNVDFTWDFVFKKE